MASKQRFVELGAAVAPRFIAVATATVIEIGDMLWFDATNNVVKPASDYTWDTDLATTQGTFKDVFAGVAMSAHKANDTSVTMIRVGTRGCVKMDCASAAFDAGTFIGPAKQSGNLLENQKVAAVANATLAIAKPWQQYTSAVTEIRIGIASTVFDSGVQTVT